MKEIQVKIDSLVKVINLRLVNRKDKEKAVSLSKLSRNKSFISELDQLRSLVWALWKVSGTEYQVQLVDNCISVLALK